MSEENNFNNELPMEAFEAMIEESLQQPSKGAVVTGVVAQINDNDVLVNIGYKTEGIAPRSDFEQDGALTVKVGDEVDVMVVNVSGGGGYVNLSRKMLNDQTLWDAVKRAVDSGDAVEVKITEKVEKGYIGRIGNDIEAFIPESHIDFKNRVKDPKSYIGAVMQAKVLKLGNRKRSALVSPKLCLVEAANASKKEFFDGIAVGGTIKGEVKTVMNYGVFISFGAVDGFLHKNNISWGHVKHPGKYLHEGDTVETQILDINVAEGKIEVGLKQLQQDPWTLVGEKYPADAIVKGTIVTRKRQGFVVELEAGIDGFIPTDELSWLKNARMKLEQGDQIEGRVLGVDEKTRKVILSIRMLNENPWKTITEKYPEGSVVSGSVKNVTDFGIFVDFGEFIDGLVRKGDISWTDDADDLRTLYKTGDKIEAKILRIDAEKERISLGVKQLETNPWKDAVKNFPYGKAVEVTVAGVTHEGLVVELPKGVFATVPVAELDDNQTLAQFKEGDEIKATVIKADPRMKQIVFSIKKFNKETERREVKEYIKQMDSETDASFGNIMRDLFKK